MARSASLSDHTVAVYKTHDEAAAALKILTDGGHNPDHLSVIGQDYAIEEEPIGFINTGERVMSWGRFGAFWGTVWGFLLGSAMMFIPGIGYVMYAGWLVSALEGTLVGGGVGALAAVLAGIGIPNDTVVKYHAVIKDGGYMVVVHGDEGEVAQATAQLQNTPATSLNSFTTPPKAA